MELMCGAFSSDLLANWVGAIGSAGAAILAVLLWRMDKAAARRRDEESRQASRMGQAMHVCVLLDHFGNQLRALEDYTRTEASKATPVESITFSSPLAIMDAMTDPAAFDTEDLAELAALVTFAQQVNHRVHAAATGHKGRLYVGAGALDQKEIEGAIRVCSSCAVKMWAHATRGTKLFRPD